MQERTRLRPPVFNASIAGEPAFQAWAERTAAKAVGVSAEAAVQAWTHWYMERVFIGLSLSDINDARMVDVYALARPDHLDAISYELIAQSYSIHSGKRSNMPADLITEIRDSVFAAWQGFVREVNATLFDARERLLVLKKAQPACWFLPIEWRNTPLFLSPHSAPLLAEPVVFVATELAMVISNPELGHYVPLMREASGTDG